MNSRNLSVHRHLDAWFHQTVRIARAKSGTNFPPPPPPPLLLLRGSGRGYDGQASIAIQRRLTAALASRRRRSSICLQGRGMSVKGGTQCDSKQCSQSGCSPNRPLFGCLQVCMHAPSPDSIAVPVDASRDIEPLFRAVA